MKGKSKRTAVSKTVAKRNDNPQRAVALKRATTTKRKISIEATKATARNSNGVNSKAGNSKAGNTQAALIGRRAGNATARARASKTKAAVRPMPVRPTTTSMATPAGPLVVGIGASAGGLEALERLFAAVAPSPHLAFVVVQHLDPKGHSVMDEILARKTRVPIAKAADGDVIAGNCIYLAPAGQCVALMRGRLHLVTPADGGRAHLPIDFLFRSLADDQGERAVGIVLSGTGNDGTLGVRAIKGAGGLTLAQDPADARYDSMPASAIASGCIDFVLTPAAMQQQLLAYMSHPYTTLGTTLRTALVETAGPNHLEKALLLLRARTGHDFTQYKRNTIGRRIERRMALHQLTDLADYVRYLGQNEAEVTALFKELLIGVTSFFRDADAFAELRDKVLRPLTADKANDGRLRIWVAGCSTGEEAYSLAMLLGEGLAYAGNDKVQIFATDIDEEALECARSGHYSAAIEADVEPARLQQFFIKQDGGYRVKKRLREMIIFAKQDLVKDPPFSHLDLIVCRNLLIYLDQPLQQRLLPLFHFVLNPSGYLMLGPSETIGEFVDLFSLVDKKWKIFQRKGYRRMTVEFPKELPPIRAPLEPRPQARAEREPSAADLAQRNLLEAYAPPGVVVNENYDVVHFQGRTGRYLEPPTGGATLNVLKMARDDLRIELRGALHKAFTKRVEVVRAGLRMKLDGRVREIDLTVRPLADERAGGLMLVVFQESGRGAKRGGRETPIRDGGNESYVDQRILELESELTAIKESLQTAIEELETSNEELKSANEELQSTNEEMQSTNQELEISQEELQSINEELVTVNAELQTKVDELSQSTSDLMNLLSSSKVGTLFVDQRLRIRRFTPVIGELMNVIESDIGRPLSDIAHNLDYGGFATDVNAVLQELTPVERDVQARSGGWYLMRILPYRTLANAIDGVVISFIDITVAKTALLAAEAARRHAEAVIAAVPRPLLVLNAELRILSTNAAYREMVATQTVDGQYAAALAADIEGQLVLNVNGGQWNAPAVRTLLTQVPREGAAPATVEIDGRAFGRGAFRVSACALPAALGAGDLILMSVEPCDAARGAADVS